MRLDQAEKLAAQITEEAGIPASVQHVEGGAAPPYGYVVEADGRRVSTMAQWSADDSRPYVVSLRMSQELGATLRQLAEVERRPLNQYIIMLLEEQARSADF